MAMDAAGGWVGETCYNRHTQGHGRVLVGNWAEEQRLQDDMAAAPASFRPSLLWANDPQRTRGTRGSKAAVSSAFLTRDPEQVSTPDSHFTSTTASTFVPQPHAPSRLASSGVRRRVLEAGIIHAVNERMKPAVPPSLSRAAATSSAAALAGSVYTGRRHAHDHVVSVVGGAGTTFSNEGSTTQAAMTSATNDDGSLHTMGLKRGDTTFDYHTDVRRFL
eukprot:TRINITY_DN1554_c0_g1_i2.p1 TRINITY_DN1554_c0_g1~~TRINITY_DN1554_c0_g1_i2.p1  ORF type:complete len:219 (+),score=14.05 TRINITY_DN1554_c0_g1_i2:90-746(+)